MDHAFTSARERRLWLWALTVLVLIYATMGQAPEIAASFRERSGLRIAGAIVLALAGLTILLRWLRTRPRSAEVAVAIAVVAAYTMAWARIDSFEERTHLFEYGVVAVLAHMALTERGAPLWKSALATTGAVAMLGIIDELVQLVLPGRVFDLRDIGFNLFAVFAAVGARMAVLWARRRRASRDL